MNGPPYFRPKWGVIVLELCEVAVPGRQRYKAQSARTTTVATVCFVRGEFQRAAPSDRQGF